MKKINYKIELKELRLPESELKKFEGLSEYKVLLENYILQMANVKAPNGPSGSLRASIRRILSALDADTVGVLEVEEAEYDALKGLFLDENLAVPVHGLRVFNLISDAVKEAV